MERKQGGYQPFRPNLGINRLCTGLILGPAQLTEMRVLGQRHSEADVMAGTLAATVEHENEGHTVA